MTFRILWIYDFSDRMWKSLHCEFQEYRQSNPVEKYSKNNKNRVLRWFKSAVSKSGGEMHTCNICIDILKCWQLKS